MSNDTAQALHGTNPLTTEGDLAAQMVEVLDGYVTDAIADSLEKRERCGIATIAPTKPTLNPWNRIEKG